jgi:exonuclease III
MLKNFITHDVDIALLQEVSTFDLNQIPCYTEYSNRGTEGRGMAFLIKDGLQMKNFRLLPSGRGIAAETEGIWFINIYAPAGAEKRAAREVFFAHELSYLLPTSQRDMILAGDFNCVLDSVDCMGTANYSRALENLITGSALHDVWDRNNSRHGYSYYAPNAASRLDRIYVTARLHSQKKGVEKVATAFTDHCAVLSCLATDKIPPVRGRSYWHMNVSYGQEKAFQTVL